LTNVNRLKNADTKLRNPDRQPNLTIAHAYL
jgi:hypothetical protein